MHRIKHYIERRGKKYIPALPPSKFRRGEVGTCFDTCLVAAMQHGVKYVEGFAKNPISKKWILHAWVTDGVHAYDLTWQAFLEGQEIPVPTEYRGVEMDTKLVADFVVSTGFKCILRNAPKDYKLARKILCL